MRSPHPRVRRPQVIILGLRGLGDIQGGIETHVTELVRHLGLPAGAVEVIGRSPYRAMADPAAPGARQIWLPTLRKVWFETPFHTLLGIGYAAVRRPRVLHLHGIGPALTAPIARTLGLTVVVTHHGEDYRREKWGWPARQVLRLGEFCSVRLAHATIAVSPVSAARLAARHRRAVACIPNGARAIAMPPPGAMLARHGLAPGGYVVSVARVVPEKRQIDLVRAFRRAAVPGLRLVLIGGADHDQPYLRTLRREIDAGDDVIMAGHLGGEALHELFAHAGLFVLPSSHEGLPLVALEAMGFGLPMLLSDLPVYRAMGLPERCLFPVGDIAAMAVGIAAQFDGGGAPPRLAWPQLADYDWHVIARRTLDVYRPWLAN